MAFMSSYPQQLPPASYPQPPHSGSSGSGSMLLGCGFGLSFLFNVVALVIIFVLCAGLSFRNVDTDSATAPMERFVSGNKSARDKVAVLSIDGTLMEGLLGFTHKQIEQAGKDEKVKAVVIRINSPGGSITASDDLYRQIVELRDGNPTKKIAARPVIVSMGSVAASGGYYIAAPANQIFAERSTITGSIGVYASFPNAKELANKVGVSMNTIKAGAIKDIGSLFHEMKPNEQQVIQDMVDDAYVQFLSVIEKGRPKLTRAVMLERFRVQPLKPDPRLVAAREPYERYRADGGVFTATQAKELGLIDNIGTLDEAIAAAASAAELDDYRAIKYQKPISFTELLLNARSDASPTGQFLQLNRLRAVFTPRLWYLAPSYEGAALLDAAMSN
jgi:protease-4